MIPRKAFYDTQVAHRSEYTYTHMMRPIANHTHAFSHYPNLSPLKTLRRESWTLARGVTTPFPPVKWYLFRCEGENGCTWNTALGTALPLTPQHPRRPGNLMAGGSYDWYQHLCCWLLRYYGLFFVFALSCLSLFVPKRQVPLPSSLLRGASARPLYRDGCFWVEAFLLRKRIRSQVY